MLRLLPLALWAGLIGLGGLWLAAAAFRLEKRALFPVGLALGWALQNLLASLLAYFVPFTTAAWLGGGLTLLAGLSAALLTRRELPARRRLLPPLHPGAAAAFVAISLAAIAMARGTAIFDDYAHLPVVSVTAAGFYPLKFPLDPQAPLNYHSFLLFTAAQISRLGSLAPWSALDIGRGLSTGLAVCLAWAWGSRLTRSSAGGLLSGLALLTASGARWLLLLLPGRLLNYLSIGTQMLGSGAASGETLQNALASVWAVDGAGPAPFPFAFVNGLMQPGALVQFSSIGLLEPAFILALLLIFPRRRGWAGALGAILLFSPFPLLSEAGPLLGFAGLAAMGVLSLLNLRPAQRRKQLSSLAGWAGITLAGLGIGLLPGGALTEILLGLLAPASGGNYHSMGFQPLWPPALVSAHLGVLRLLNPGQLILAFAEAGPLVLLLPRLLRWGRKAARALRWYEAALAGEALISLAMVFVQYSGSEGIRNTSRLYRFMPVLVIFAVPLIWPWLRRLAQARPTPRVWLGRLGLGAGMAAAMLGGLGVLLILLPAMQRPMYSNFVEELDARMFHREWNHLERDALIFDRSSHRAPTLFGRYTNSNTTWFALKPEWVVAAEAPLPASLRAAGFSYAYWDNLGFASLAPEIQDAWKDPCLKLTAEETLQTYWRRLYDLRGCMD